MTPLLSRLSGSPWSCLRALLVVLCVGLLLVPNLTAAPVLPVPQLPPRDGRSAASAIPAARFAKHVAIVSVHGPIDPMTLQTLERRLDDAVRDGCDGVVLELNTPGGDLEATLAICHLLKTHGPTNKVAWVRPYAFSAGAIIAVTCREIIVSDASQIGDAAPIAIAPGEGLTPLPQAERAKLAAPVLTEVTESAQRNGYDLRLVRAFITVEDELWLIERDDGKRIFANAQEYEIVFGEPPARNGERPMAPIEPPALREPPTTEAAPEADLEGGDDSTTTEEASEGEQPTVVVQQPGNDGDAADRGAELFAHEPRVTEAEAGRWKLLGQVDTATELVTLSGSEATRYGFASAMINTEQELAQFFGGAKLTRYDESWSEGLVRFLISWPVRFILIIVVVVSFFIEMATPGLGIFGAVAGVGLLLLIGGPALAGLAQWWEVLFIVLGIALLLIEFLVTPGLGIAGIVGALLLLIGLVFSFVSGDLSSPKAQTDLVIGFVSTLGAFALSGVGIGLLLKRMPESRLMGRFALQATVTARPELLVARSVASVAAEATGVTLTDLRPSGQAQFGETVVDVRSASGWISAGRPIRVIRRDGMGLVVEEVRS